MGKKDVQKIRMNILGMAYRAQEGHIPSSFSVVELLYVLYANMREGDVFLLSKGHASAALYAVLAHFNFLDRKELDTYCKYESRLGGHPQRDGELVRNASGSLGHGFPIAAGYALAKKIKKESGRVFCLVGDGETNEGTIWETALYAEQLRLSNLLCIVDNNNSQTRAMVSVNIKEKFDSFGWATKEVMDGHDIAEIKSALFSDKAKSVEKPFCIVANTVKGKGIREMENNFAWHHRAPTKEEFGIFQKELSL